MYYLDLDDPTSPLKLFSAREEDRIYDIEHQGDSFIVLTNRYLERKYINNIIMRSPISQEKSHYITGVYPLEKYIVLDERVGGFAQLRVIETSSGAPPKDNGYLIRFSEPSFTAHAEEKYMGYNSTELFFRYASLTTPDSLFKYDLTTRTRTLLKTEPVLGNFDSKKYVTERKDGSNPLHLYGYGSFGVSMDPGFISLVIPLLDRGFVYAIAHVRGGSEMGRQWYEIEGKLLKKRNTIRDFSNVARHLIAKNYTSPAKLSIEGGSAGGLLIGAVINLNPGLFNAAIMDVPFVDLINTMMDSTIPFIVSWYEEWGNPNNITFFTHMKSYSPYDNFSKSGEGLPHLLVRSGLSDPRVQYWAPAKYVAKLRDVITKSPATKSR
ncbi:hypothetical protein DSO57_1003716 [Entomophthora muscae]|uniref:Uncharacterized protein n=1 Tax=Entomophthora muscae TaxID=34485 RepID=A0ACC2SXG9_9FUNG|nr:hypothetical protein DSO57_1003716 [Entomophthora muscae]